MIPSGGQATGIPNRERKISGIVARDTGAARTAEMVDVHNGRNKLCQVEMSLPTLPFDPLVPGSQAEHSLLERAAGIFLVIGLSLPG